MSLRELHAHPAIYNPWMVLRELWLDRALLLLLLLSFQIFSFMNVFVAVSLWWFFVPFSLFLPAFIFYAQSVTSDVHRVQREAMRRAPAAARIAGVGRVVHGHTHREGHVSYKGIELLNNGTWSPDFHDVECTTPDGRKGLPGFGPAVLPPALMGKRRSRDRPHCVNGRIRVSR